MTCRNLGDTRINVLHKNMLSTRHGWVPTDLMAASEKGIADRLAVVLCVGVMWAFVREARHWERIAISLAINPLRHAWQYSAAHRQPGIGRAGVGVWGGHWSEPRKGGHPIRGCTLVMAAASGIPGPQHGKRHSGYAESC